MYNHFLDIYLSCSLEIQIAAILTIVDIGSAAFYSHVRSAQSYLRSIHECQIRLAVFVRNQGQHHHVTLLQTQDRERTIVILREQAVITAAFPKLEAVVSAVLRLWSAGKAASELITGNQLHVGLTLDVLPLRLDAVSIAHAGKRKRAVLCEDCLRTLQFDDVVHHAAHAGDVPGLQIDGILTLHHLSGGNLYYVECIGTCQHGASGDGVVARRTDTLNSVIAVHLHLYLCTAGSTGQCHSQVERGIVCLVAVPLDTPGLAVRYLGIVECALVTTAHGEGLVATRHLIPQSILTLAVAQAEPVSRMVGLSDAPQRAPFLLRIPCDVTQSRRASRYRHVRLFQHACRVAVQGVCIQRITAWAYVLDGEVAIAVRLAVELVAVALQQRCLAGLRQYHLNLGGLGEVGRQVDLTCHGRTGILLQQTVVQPAVRPGILLFRSPRLGIGNHSTLRTAVHIEQARTEQLRLAAIIYTSLCTEVRTVQCL